MYPNLPWKQVKYLITEDLIWSCTQFRQLFWSQQFIDKVILGEEKLLYSCCTLTDNSTKLISKLLLVFIAYQSKQLHFKELNL